jgi:oxygen-independent coproporphyrinogen-3 oxidase
VSPSALPDGDLAPADGALPEQVVDGASARAFGVYLHVPFCAARCGYCDFNTYTALELGPPELPGASAQGWAGAALDEIALAAGVLERSGLPPREVSTVFVGGGTPTLLPSADLVKSLHGLRDRWGLAPGAEVTTEANPDSVTPESLAELAAGGFTRVSFGMQSAVRSVLATLDRTHDPERLPRVVGWARDAGLQVSLDLIYGTPGERDEDWATSLAAVTALAPDHVSAYALVVEEGTALAAQVRRGRVQEPDPDAMATRYEMADDALGAAGLGWYEVSNWATGPGTACRHNLGYWRGDDWWGVGPGAHSHVGGVRWWNVKHPAAWAKRLAAGTSPAAAREVLDADARRSEAVLLGVRLAEGLDPRVLEPSKATAATVAELVQDGLLEPGNGSAAPGRLVLTRRGRLLADLVVRRLLCW